ncbi:hypothetical protein KP509_17G048900 [Ceratopteris richardii]|uniref:Uncharacterized protein n=1 Tax=Ceratopteris richardii TaxID=49495 RepID=A0A8T2SY30_CERRI|nr:hypothetical protein KP509_17G048900 [Ceratopteris richardii]
MGSSNCLDIAWYYDVHCSQVMDNREKPDLETASVRVQLDAETQKRLRLENKVTCVDTALNSMRRLRQGTSKSGRFIRQQLKR